MAPFAAKWYTMIIAADNALIDPKRTMTGSKGDRYTMSKITNTTASATNNNVTSMPPKAFCKSRANEAGPASL